MVKSSVMNRVTPEELLERHPNLTVEEAEFYADVENGDSEGDVIALEEKPTLN